MPAQTINEIIDRLESITRESVVTGNQLGIFAQVYLGVTKLVKAGIREGRFDDGPRMERLDVIFANRYLDAYDQFQKKQRCTHAWQTAFEGAARPGLAILQHLFLGMNAHINLDLGIAAAETVAPEELPSLRADFYQINQLLTEQIEQMKRQVHKVSPLLFLLDWSGTKRDEKFAAFSLKKARAHAWIVAQRLSKLSPKEKETAISELDEYVNVLNRLITGPGIFFSFFIRIVHWFEEKDVKTIIASLDMSLTE